MGPLKKSFMGNFTFPMMGIYKSKKQLKELEYSLALGINYVHIKGADMSRPLTLFPISLLRMKVSVKITLWQGALKLQRK